MDRHALSKDESEAFEAIRQALLGLPIHSQYAVLGHTAHMMDREVVRIGAVRAAAAVAGSTARSRADLYGMRKDPPSEKSNFKKQKGYPPDFVNAHKVLMDKQAACKAAMSDPPTPSQREELREASKRVREAYKLFLAQIESKKEATGIRL